MDSKKWVEGGGWEGGGCTYHLPLRVERDGQWVTWTFHKYYTEVAAAAKSLVRLGLERFHGVCILGFNAPEWFIAYMAGIMVSRFTHVSTSDNSPLTSSLCVYIGRRNCLWCLHH